jgi:hypothetical protein
VHSDNPDWTKRAKEILERTGAEDISSSAEARADYAKSNRPASRTASDVEAVQIRREGKAVGVDRPAGPRECPECGLVLESEAELRDHATTCGDRSRPSAASELDAGEVAKTPAH